MRLPNPDRAIVDIAKLEAYCLDPLHPYGGNKARVFAALGFTRRDARWLRMALLNAAYREAKHVGTSAFGANYAIDFELDTQKGTIPVRSGWIVRKAEDFPRLTTFYVLK